MRKILVIGAGKSASNLITYLLEKSEKENLHITIGDLSLKNATMTAKFLSQETDKNCFAM